jgi:GNAT superfamily N-acetyltransferase
MRAAPLSPEVEFIVANAMTHRAELIELNFEYVSWVLAGVAEMFGVSADQVVGMPAIDYAPKMIDKICSESPLAGVFYLVRVDGLLAGMGALRRLGPGLGEIKRVYLRPKFRGLRLGERTLHRLLADARSFGYQRLCLDTAPFMTAAHRLYENNGFSDCSAYAGAEVLAGFDHHWRFMERQL